MACEKHRKQPAWGYSDCPGCEVERSRAEISELKNRVAELEYQLRNSCALSLWCHLEAECWLYFETLEKISRVNAMDYEYQKWATEAMASVINLDLAPEVKEMLERLEKRS